MSDAWWQSAVFYCADVETFADGDGDGVGDLVGMVDHLDHLVDLGIDAIWLLPINPSSNRDDGYDVVDYCAVDPRLGTLDLFRALVGAAHDRGLRVVLDLPLNHTSDRHPWFRAARHATAGRYGRYYVWAKDKPSEPPTSVFPDEVPSPWTFDEAAGLWYLHHFHPFQPDLNTSNPEVWAQLRDVVRFWLEQGLDGLRIDAAPFLIEGDGRAAMGDRHAMLRDLRAHVDSVRPGTVLIGEANVETEEQPAYFGDGDELQVLFDYTLNAGLILGLALEQAWPIRRALSRVPGRPQLCQWLSFLRIHDELSLERLDDDERKAVFERWAPDPEDRLYDRGLRRRLPPMLGDPQRMRLALSLLLSLPGSPCLLWGEEIGMGDNRSLPGRLASRAPVQWSAAPSGGFSTASPDQLVRPLVDETGFGPGDRNVADQRDDPESLLSFVRRAIALRRSMPGVFHRCEVVDGVPEPVLVHRCPAFDTDGSASDGSAAGTFVAVHNLGGDRVPVDLSRWSGPGLHDLFTGEAVGDGMQAEVEVELEPYGLRWLAG